MAWTELSERNSQNYGERSVDTLAKVKQIKSLIMQVCEDLESMSYGERGMQNQNYGERRAWRIEEDERGRYSNRY